MSIIVKQKEFKSIQKYKECCCSGLDYALSCGLFKIKTDLLSWLMVNGPTHTFKFNGVFIKYCPYCGKKLEIINDN